ncbi:paraquat-inducible protein A, partial [Gemmatimonas sp.]
SAASYRLYGVVQAMSKWSMADVFAVGMLIALLVGKGTANLSAVAGPGFYFFAAYCLVSNAAFQALRIELPTAVVPTSSATTSSPFSARS